MDADALIHEVREGLDEPNANKQYYTNDLLLSMINHVYVTLAFEFEFLKKTTNYVSRGGTTMNRVDSIADSPVHIMPSDFLKICSKRGVIWQKSSTSSRELTGKTKEEMISEGIWDGNNVSGTPNYFIWEPLDGDIMADAGWVSATAGGEAMMIYPYPDSAGNKLRAGYVAAPTDLVSTLTETSPAATATSPIFLARFHMLLVWDTVLPKLLKRRRKDDAFANMRVLRDNLHSQMQSYYTNRKTGQPMRARKAVGRKTSIIESFETL